MECMSNNKIRRHGMSEVKDICYQIKNGVFPMRGTRVLSKIT